MSGPADRRWPRLSDCLDPFFLAVILTGVVVAAGLAATGGDGGAVLGGWLSGFSSLFAFAMQMILMLALGHAVATSPRVLGRIQGLAGWIAGRRSPAFWVCVFTAACAWLHWGLGLIAGGLIARAAAAKVEGDATAAVRNTAAAYGGFLVWHGGLSGSAPLVMATPDHFLIDIAPVVPIDQTVFSLLNLTLLVLVVAAVATAAAKLKVTTETPGGDVAKPRPIPAESPSLVGPLLGLIVIAVAAAAVATGRMTVNLNFIIVVLFAVALAVQRHPEHFNSAVRDGLAGTVGIAIQFPLYGAIMGIMKETGLVVMIAEALTEGVSATLFPAAVFAAAGLINLAVPSGGGQWAVQGPIMLQAAQNLGVGIPETIVAFSWGDAWTNLIQPFWALPLLALTGARPQDVLKVTARLWLLSGVVVTAVLIALA